MSADTDKNAAVANHTALPKRLSWLSRKLALAGGFILIALALMTFSSIVGRALFNSPINGDYEIVELGLAIAVFCFLPECHLQKGHVVVDVFTTSAKQRTLAILSAATELLFVICAFVFVWRLTIGTLDAWDYADQTMVLALPYWVVYLIGVLTTLLTAINSSFYFCFDINRDLHVE